MIGVISYSSVALVGDCRVMASTVTTAVRTMSAVEAALTDDDRAMLKHVVDEFEMPQTPDDFRRIEAGRQLWTFSTKDPELWRAAL